MKHWREWDLRNISGPINFTDEKKTKENPKKSLRNLQRIKNMSTKFNEKFKKKIPNKVINITKKSIKSHG